MVISVPKALDSKLAHDQGQGPYISRFKLPYPFPCSLLLLEGRAHCPLGITLPWHIKSLR